MSSLFSIIHHRTRDDWPDTRQHGPVVLAWDERHKDYVEVEPRVVRDQPKLYPFWIPERRHHQRQSSCETAKSS